MKKLSRQSKDNKFQNDWWARSSWTKRSVRELWMESDKFETIISRCQGLSVFTAMRHEVSPKMKCLGKQAAIM